MSGAVKPLRLTFAEIVGLVSAVARRNWSFLLLYIVGLGAACTAMDYTGVTAASTGASIAVYLIGYVLYERILRREGLMAPGRAGWSLGTYVLVGLVSGLAILVGFVALIVPALILLARWSIASALVVAEGVSTSEALSRSWRVTRTSQWSLVLLFVVFGIAFLLPWVLLGLGLGFGAGFVGSPDVGAIALALIANVYAQVISAGSVLIGVAVMLGLNSGTGELEAVFA